MITCSTVALGCGIFFGLLGVILLTMFLTFYFTRKYYDKTLKENPPITEDQIRFMYAQMGRKPTEKQVRAIMYQMKNPQK